MVSYTAFRRTAHHWPPLHCNHIDQRAGEWYTDPIDRLVMAASQHRAWLRDRAALREQIRQDGGLAVGVYSRSKPGVATVVERANAWPPSAPAATASYS